MDILYPSRVVFATDPAKLIIAAQRQHNITIELIEYKLDQLAHKVDLHNNAVERLFLAEKELELHAEKISVANHRIEDLEHIAKAGE